MCGLQLDPLAISLTQPLLLQLLDALQLPDALPEAAAAAQPPQLPPAAAAAAGGAATAAEGSGLALAGLPGGGEGAATAPVVMLDLQLKSFDLRFSGSGGSSPAAAGGGSSGRSASPSSAGRSAAASAVAAGLAALEARVSCGATSVSLHSLLDGLAVKVRGWEGWHAGLLVAPCCRPYLRHGK